MTDGYIIAINMPIVKSFYCLLIVTYLSEWGQLYEEVKSIGEGLDTRLEGFEPTTLGSED